MATSVLKVSVDGVKYAIQGVRKETSRKEILCLLAKYKTGDQLPDLQSALAKLDSAITLVKFQKVKGVTSSTCETGYKKSSCKKAVRAKPVSTGEDEYSAGLRRRLTLKSQSLNERIKKATRHGTFERPKSFAAFDTDRKLCWNELRRYFSVPLYKKTLRWEKTDKKVACDDSDLETAKAKSRKLRNLKKRNIFDDADGTSVLSATQRTENGMRTRQGRPASDKLQNWALNMEENLTTYLIDSQHFIELTNRVKSDCNNNSSISNEMTANTVCCGKKEERDIDDASDFADGETDSGLPSIDYESSSIDTISRDEMASLDQTNIETSQNEKHEDSGFDCSSLNDVVPLADTCELQQGNCEGAKVQSSVQCQEMGRELKNLEEGGETAGNAEDSKRMFDRILFLLNKISKIDEELLHKELFALQLEFQLSVICEDLDEDEEYEDECNEEELIRELRETEKFLTAITNLRFYQDAAEREILCELFYLEEEVKEKKTKLQSLERRLLRRELRWIPKHLNVSDEKRRIISNLYLNAESREYSEKVDEEAISLV